MDTRSHRQTCRLCGAALKVVFADLGMVPLCQTYISPEALFDPETFYPLRATACVECGYVGLPELVSPEAIFGEYAYFSSTSQSWSDYARRSAGELIDAFALDGSSFVVEMASNDGYLLQHFISQGIQALGVEPARNVAKVANERGVPTMASFFDRALATRLREEGRSADLLLAYNCLDHVPDVCDVVSGMKRLLKPTGVIQIEQPYLGALVEHGEFDTIYHDRVSYFSLLCLDRLFDSVGLRVFDVAQLPTHGGSLRVRICHADDPRPSGASVSRLLAAERAAGMTTSSYYEGFMERVRRAKLQLLERLIELRVSGHSIAGYGVPAKGNVLLNYCGVRRDLIDYLVDLSPYKAGKFAPGTRLPIRDVEHVRRTRPDYLLILPWNIRDEIIEQMAYIRDWGGRFVVPIPSVQIL